MFRRVVFFAASLIASSHQAFPAGAPASSLAVPAPESLQEYNLPESIARIIAARRIIDFSQGIQHRVEPGIQPTPVKMTAQRGREGQFIHVVQPELNEAVLRYRATLRENIVPPRGFRAPILDQATASQLAAPTNGWTTAERQVADLIAQRLAWDGLLPTLAQAVQRLGPTQWQTNGAATLSKLTTLGFPCDWLRYFQINGVTSPTNDPALIPSWLARRFAEGANLELLQSELRTARFAFTPSEPGFSVVTESGEHELGMLRMQAGGGYRDGVIPGGSIDVIGQLIAAFPRVDFHVSAERDIAESFQWMAAHMWRLRRKDHLTIIVEPSPVAAWAQDNGKAGLIPATTGQPARIATLTPRYASMDEGKSTFQPGESFLMDGLQAAGHRVIHSPLLFQGGNVMAVRDPKSGERILLVGEGEVARNVTLGLTREQAVEAFRLEFGVDRCALMPAASYHLDFDVSLRAHNGELVAFVNDRMEAARVILGLGIETLAKHGALDTNHARIARDDLAEKRDLELLTLLTNVVQRQFTAGVGFPATLSSHFVADKSDDAAGNLQCFLLALDLLEAATHNPPVGTVERMDYLRALQRLKAARGKQVDQLKQLGWRVVVVPSMGDLYRGINYLNGIQHRSGYILPVYGGFYEPLDRVATEVFQRALGPDARITPIRSAECQRRHGGVHCTAAAYPRL